MIWAIIPAKPLARAKTRLAGVFSSAQRRELCLEMLERVVRAVQAAPGLSWLVISRDRQALRLARAAGGCALLDRSQGLNASLGQAVRWCTARGASAVLVLPSDLPLIEGQDIAAMLDLAQEEGCLVISPCSRQEGTNALLVRPPGALTLAFGPGSFQAHLRQAQQRGLATHVYRSPRLALDIDTPEDLAAFLSARESPILNNPQKVARLSGGPTGRSANCGVPRQISKICLGLSRQGTLTEIRVIALPHLPFIQPRDDLAGIIWRCLEGGPLTLEDGDVVVVAQKVVSKAEGRLVCLEGVVPSAEARRLAEETGKDPRLVEVVLRESSRVLRARPGRFIVEQRLGIVCANAGVDRSNVPQVDSLWVSLLPMDPDASAAAIRARLKKLAGREVAVIISDSQGRPFRQGCVGIAIGVAGLRPLADRRGQADLHGRPLTSTVVALADQLASAAALALGEANEGTPVAIVRGVGYQRGPGSARELLRPSEEDLFR